MDSGPSADTISLHLGLVLSSLFLSFIFYCSASIMGFLILLLSCSFNMFEEFEFFFFHSGFLACVVRPVYYYRSFFVIEFKNFNYRKCAEI